MATVEASSFNNYGSIADALNPPEMALWFLHLFINDEDRARVIIDIKIIFTEMLNDMSLSKAKIGIYFKILFAILINWGIFKLIYKLRWVLLPVPVTVLTVRLVHPTAYDFLVNLFKFFLGK